MDESSGADNNFKNGQSEEADRKNTETDEVSMEEAEKPEESTEETKKEDDADGSGIVFRSLYNQIIYAAILFFYC